MVRDYFSDGTLERGHHRAQLPKALSDLGRRTSVPQLERDGRLVWGKGEVDGEEGGTISGRVAASDQWSLFRRGVSGGGGSSSCGGSGCLCPPGVVALARRFPPKTLKGQHSKCPSLSARGSTHFQGDGTSQAQLQHLFWVLLLVYLLLLWPQTCPKMPGTFRVGRSSESSLALLPACMTTLGW